MTAKYPYYSPYQFSGNRLIDAIELEGLEPKNMNANDAEPNKKYQAPDQQYPESDEVIYEWMSVGKKGAKSWVLASPDPVKIIHESALEKGAESMIAEITAATATKGDIDLSENVTFAGYKQTDPKGCLRRCNEMLKSAGFVPGNGSEVVWVYGTNQTFSPQLHTDAVDLIDESLENGAPIIIGVDDKPGTTGNNDKVTDHWIVIVARYTQDGKTYYRYYDPATAHKDGGTSKNNVLTEEGGQLQGYFGKLNYKLSAARKNKGENQ